MIKVLVICGIVIVVIAITVVVFFFWRPMPDVSKYESLKTPRISSMPDQRMIEIAINGIPSRVLPEAFAALFGEYYRLKDTPKGPNQSAPRLRIAVSESVGTDFEIGTKSIEMQVGLPVPDSVTALSGAEYKGVGSVKIATWKYGDVAEILHVGAYAKEPPTIKALTDFISAGGWEPVGVHEEEYLIGPGMTGATPDKYYTVIRYPVKKK